MTAPALSGTNGLFLGTGILETESRGETAAAGPSTAPNRTPWALWAASVAAGATLLSLFFATQDFLAARRFGQPISFGSAFSVQLICWCLWGAASPLVFGLVRRFPIERGRLVRRSALHAGAGLAVSAAHVMAEAALLEALSLGPPGGPFRQRLQSVFLGEFHADLLGYVAILAVGHAVTSARASRREEITRSRLEARWARSEIELLRTQLDPDFLFNTLHAISSLMHRDVEAADRMVSRLAEMLRIALRLAGRPEAPLREEVEFLERYLEIQQARFPGRLAVGLRIDSSTLDARVPCRILQPLVESAVGRRIPPGFRRIEVSSRRLEECLELRVRDTGHLPPDEEGIPADEVGLSSTRERLWHLYGNRHRIEVRKGSRGCVSVTLAIPFRINVQEESHGNSESDLEDPRPDRG